jgi:ABC-type oligopeptide transport system ATPase subunit
MRLGRTNGYVHVVDKTSLTLAKGETLGIVGESGCGKTTARMAMLKLEEPTGGKVFFQNRDISQMTRQEQKEHN